jgi:hypothetical protein
MRALATSWFRKFIFVGVQNAGSYVSLINLKRKTSMRVVSFKGWWGLDCVLGCVADTDETMP